MRFDCLSSIHDVSPAAWDALAGSHYPFTRHRFLAALEDTGCVGEAQGWIPRHAALYDDDNHLIAAAPGYLKTHSYGEFVFDFSWADAHARLGLPYYPKWLFAIPFVPVVGPRLIARNTNTRARLLQQIVTHAEQNDLPGLHILFATEAELSATQGQNLLRRRDCQYHWHNPGYASFEEFLTALPRKDRKEIRRERRRVADAGVTVYPVTAREISETQWPDIYRCYAGTYLRRGQQPYWTPEFLRALARAFPEDLLLFLARRDDDLLAAAITLRGGDTLYGRHWGALTHVDCLHFETCYYRIMEYCIDESLPHFDAGAQGEHKLQRGFAPVTTGSSHWIPDPRLRQAIADFLRREAAAVEGYVDYCLSRRPQPVTEST